ncbi:Beta-1,4-galactosyltransferase [uncultured Candidatus Thioglobus sp.]|nr:Beta-1,4-galactosyltransferase [uncultured Candidatus Thioglobus sp.]
MIKTYVINLIQAKDRLESVTKNLDNIGLEFEIIKAVNGKEITLPHPDFSQISYQLMHGKRPNLGELGCYFSHIKTLEKFLQTNEEFALILEDDIEAIEQIPTLINQAIKYQQHWDILHLSGFHSGTPIKFKKLSEKHFLTINLTRQGGSGAYVINRKGAKALIKHLLPMRLPYDHAFDREWLFGIKSLWMQPFPVNQRFDDSYIWSLGFTKFKFIYRLPTFIYRLFNELMRVFFRGMQAIIYQFK